jgi:pimeloyl-ACP methyl ester carboxylesterase
MAVRPFTIAVLDADLADLARRLDAVRWPATVDGAGWELGTDAGELRALVEHWRDGFDWRREEAALNRLAQFVVRLGEREVHVVHAHGRGPAPLPIVLTHGWPGSFVEMTKVLPLLVDPSAHGADPADAFDIVIPSLPGYGFSPAPPEPGWNVFRIADLWVELMAALGYQRFVAQGGDFGAGVSTALALRHPERLFGIHLNYIPGSYRPYLEPGEELAADELEFFAAAQRWWDEEGAYAHLQATKPHTLAFALADSPVGLAAWMVEKLRSWSDCDGRLERRFSRDETLTQVSLYWFTGSMASAIRLYREGRLRPLRLGPGETVRLPCGIARFPREEPFPPRRYIERGYRVEHWTEMPRGGHFAAWEEPELLAADLRVFCRRFRANARPA